MWRDERDRRELARRRELLPLPMLPLSRVTGSGVPQDAWPDPATWESAPSVIGTGPGGEALALVRNRARADRALVRHLDGEGPVVVLDGAVHADFVQPLPGGRVLLVGGRARRGTENAQVWDGSGRLVASAFVGDAVAHVLTTPAGAIWVGYFDEAHDDLGAHKLVRFDDELRPQWAYPYPTERPDLPGVFDVYALNVSGETALCYAYTAFHLVRVRADVLTDHGPTGIRGARAVLVEGDRGAVVGGYGAEHDLVTPLRLRRDGVEVGAPVGRLVLPDGHELSGLRFTAHGPRLDAVDAHGSRYRTTLDDLLDARPA